MPTPRPATVRQGARALPPALAIALGPGALHAQSSLRLTHLVDLGTLGSATSFGYGINAVGQIVGDAFLAGGSPRGLIFQDSMRSVGTVADYVVSNGCN